MSLSLIVRGHNSLFFFKLEKTRKNPINFTVRQTRPLFAETCTRARHGSRVAWLHGQQEKQLYDTRSEITTGSRTDSTIFSAVKQFMVWFQLNHMLKSRNLKVGLLVAIDLVTSSVPDLISDACYQPVIIIENSEALQTNNLYALLSSCCFFFSFTVFKFRRGKHDWIGVKFEVV